VRDDIEIVAPNFKTTGNGRYSYLNAWGYGLRQGDGDEAAAYEFVRDIVDNVLVMAPGGRAATNAFVSDGLGDVLLTFESEVNLIARDLGPDDFDVVVPSYGIDAKMYVVIVDQNAEAAGTAEVANAYWDFLYSTRGQEIIAESYYRPYDQSVAARYEDLLPEIELFDVDEVLGGWIHAREVHFADGGTYDQIVLELGLQ
ncbi:MAG: sulfate ABC transporter substrate-binding protein, partial [Spirochaetales bacterium]|nr:sulfate ABC transporter substrate-binding protein [Spirochaetales bacterium]